MIQFRINSGRWFPSEVTRMKCSPPRQQLMDEHYKMEFIGSGEGRMPLCVLDPVHELPLRLANYGELGTEDKEEWGIILGEGETIFDKAFISIYLEAAFTMFILSSISETPFIFWIGAQLILLGGLDGLFGFNIRCVSQKKLPITLAFFLFVLTNVISPKENEGTLSQRLGLVLCRGFGSYYLLWIY